jgi:glucose-1-phosphate cytidylyltransferase
LKTIILAGGLGSWIGDDSVRIPKSMVEVGGRPIIARIMDIYSHFGHQDFIVATGYKSLLIKQFFANYNLIANDITVALDSGQMTLRPASPGGWSVSVVDTGPDQTTSGRIQRLKEWLDGETFMVTYGDGLGNVDIDALLAFHRSHGKLATMTAVRPHAQVGCVEIKGDRVDTFSDTVQNSETWINGGFFVFEPDVLDYLTDDAESLEKGPLPQMTRDGNLMAFRHFGFWHPMDTLRDRNKLCKLAAEDVPPWLEFDNTDRSPTTASGEGQKPHIVSA